MTHDRVTWSAHSSERARIRRWRRRIYRRLFMAIGIVLWLWTVLILLAALWFSNMDHGAEVIWTALLVMVGMVVASFLRRLWREDREELDNG